MRDIFQRIVSIGRGAIEAVNIKGNERICISLCNRRRLAIASGIGRRDAGNAGMPALSRGTTEAAAGFFEPKRLQILLRRARHAGEDIGVRGEEDAVGHGIGKR